MHRMCEGRRSCIQLHEESHARNVIPGVGGHVTLSPPRPTISHAAEPSPTLLAAMIPASEVSPCQAQCTAHGA